jgi:hypothetical protein
LQYFPRKTNGKNQPLFVTRVIMMATYCTVLGQVPGKCWKKKSGLRLKSLIVVLREFWNVAVVNKTFDLMMSESDNSAL